MSAPSGIKVPADISSSFTAAQGQGDAVRALVWVIEGESFKLHDTINRQSTFKDDIELLPKSLPSPKTPASFAYRLDSKDGGKYEWMMITFVPDDAGVRAKMLQASSRGGLMKALGAGNFKHDWFATSLKDLTPSALTSHLNHLASPAPLSAAEKALAEVREAEAAEAKRTALDPEAENRRKQAIVGLGGAMKMQGGVKEALEKVAQRSDDGWAVILEIPSNDTSGLSLVTSEACTPSQVASKVPPKNPSYTFYSFPTPPPPASPATPSAGKTWKSQSPAVSGNAFHASEGGKRFVTSTWTKGDDATRIGAASGEGDSAGSEKKEGSEGEDGEGAEADVNKLSISTDTAEEGEQEAGEIASSPEETKISPAPSASVKDIKGRVIFIYSCPSSSPVKFRMIYSTSVRGVQQDAINLGVEIVGKEETSDPKELTESLLRSALPSSSFKPSTQPSHAFGKPTHTSSLPTPSSANISSSPSFGAPKPAFGAPAPAFGGAFGRPRPVVKKVESYSSNTSASQIPLPASAGPGTPISPSASAPAGTDGDEGDSKERIKSAFDAFGPRVGGGGGGGFARPRPAGRR